VTLWSCREKSTAALSGALQPLAALLEEAFARVDEAVSYFEKFQMTSPAPAGRVCALVVMKGRNLALGCYSLTLDGLAQESGALLRPLLEAIELLCYLRDVPGAVDSAIDGKLPSPGDRARRIRGTFHELRKYLNTDASHLGLGFASTRHLVDFRTGKLRPVQHFSEFVLEQNMAVLFAFTAMLVRESAACFRWCAYETVPTSAESLVNKALRCIEAGEPIVHAIFEKRAETAEQQQQRG
jgi:hypothetical protein